MTLCVLTAIVFWMFNAFNKNYSANVRFPILFEFNGEKFVPAEHLPKNITLNVTGIGWDLFRKYVGLRESQIIIPLDRPNEIRKIVANSLLPVIATQLGNFKINFVATDTLYLRIDKRDAHRYQLLADISSVTFKEGYGRISPVVVLPDSIKIEGPESRLHAIIDSIVLKIDKKNINENFREEVEIVFEGSEFVKRDPPLAQVMFEVGQVQNVTRRLKISTNKKIILTADSVMAKFQVPVSRFSDFNSLLKDISVTVNIENFGLNNSALPQVSNLPSYVQLVSVDSVHVKPH
ncbi:MAG: hypothetical protein QM734_12565 [Cyclobacteriaceae bacterium]